MPPESPGEVHANSGPVMLSLILQTIYVAAVNTNCTMSESKGKTSFLHVREICLALDGSFSKL